LDAKATLLPILLVEDEENLREAFTRVLTAAGFRVIVAGRGEDALNRLSRAEKLAVLVTDIRLPDMYGRRLAERVLEQQPDLRVLYVSGNAEEISREAPPSARERFLGKPCDLGELVSTVQALAADARAGEGGE
jgi:CheY-like chemotaxis protein